MGENESTSSNCLFAMPMHKSNDNLATKKNTDKYNDLKESEIFSSSSFVTTKLQKKNKFSDDSQYLKENESCLYLEDECLYNNEKLVQKSTCKDIGNKRENVNFSLTSLSTTPLHKVHNVIAEKTCIGDDHDEIENLSSLSFSTISLQKKKNREKSNDMKENESCLHPNNERPENDEEFVQIKSTCKDLGNTGPPFDAKENKNSSSTSFPARPRHKSNNKNTCIDNDHTLKESKNLNLASLSTIAHQKKKCNGNISLKENENSSTTFSAKLLQKKNKMLDKTYDCFICGLSLSSNTIKGRIMHVKRCAKKYNVSARDLKLNELEDEYRFTNLLKEDTPIYDDSHNYGDTFDDDTHASAFTNLDEKDIITIDDDNDEITTSSASTLNEKTNINNFLVSNAKKLVEQKKQKE